MIDTWRDLHAEVAARVPAVEARWLVEGVSGLDRSRWSEPAPADGAGRLNALVERRLAGEPLQYVLGRWSFRGLDLLLEDDLLARAQSADATPSLSWQGRETFARSLLELRETALGLDALSLFACSASVETMALTSGDVEERLDGVMSTPRFLRETAGAQLVFV